MRLGPAARAQLAELIASAAPLKGDFFRSVAFRYFHPDDLISGEGTRLNGGRFVPVGVPAVYASLEEETALREVIARKNALGGRRQINVGEYPRMTYILAVDTKWNIDLAASLAPELGAVVRRCLRARTYSASQDWHRSGWPRVSTALYSLQQPVSGRNVVVYLQNATPGSIVVRNRGEVLAALRRPRGWVPGVGRLRQGWGPVLSLPGRWPRRVSAHSFRTGRR